LAIVTSELLHQSEKLLGGVEGLAVVRQVAAVVGRLPALTNEALGKQTIFEQYTGFAETTI